MTGLSFWEKNYYVDIVRLDENIISMSKIKIAGKMKFTH